MQQEASRRPEVTDRGGQLSSRLRLSEVGAPNPATFRARKKNPPLSFKAAESRLALSLKVNASDDLN